MKVGLICRCKDEFFIEEFTDYYLDQGIDELYIIDDDSKNKSIYDDLEARENIHVIFEKDIIRKDYVNALYGKIKDKFDWIVYVDADEFITTKKSPNKTIRNELETTFKDTHCIMVPWVMMSCNSLEKSPSSILESNIYRWDHDLRHPNRLSTQSKFRCRYEEIEVKCIFKPKYFDGIWDHHPKRPVADEILRISESIENKPCTLDPFYQNLREMHISTGYLLCYHYRIISVENCIKKLKTNSWYIKNGYNLQDLMSTDYPEITDRTMQEKYRKIYNS